MKPGSIGLGFGPKGSVVPGTPSITLAVAGSTVTVTIDGDAGVTNYVLYWKSGDVAWSSGDNRAGDGTVDVNGLTPDVSYTFCAYSALAGINSLFSGPKQTAIVTGAGSDVTATGEMGLAATNLRDLLSMSSTFQTAVGAGDAETAKDSIFISEYFPDDAAFVRPFGLIVRSGDRSESIGSTGFGSGGELELWFERAIHANYQADDQAENAELEFLNFVDGCIADCQALSGQSGYLLTRSWDPDEPFRIQDEHIFGIKIRVGWGLVG